MNEYRDRVRILLIIYFFGDKYDGEDKSIKKVLYSEVKIQKIDFLIRYPDYLCFELISLVRENKVTDSSEVKKIIDSIFGFKEPEIRRDEMLRYCFGAYEDIDNIISFWSSVGFLKYYCKMSIDGRDYSKAYYLTDKGINSIEGKLLPSIKAASWYVNRCKLIKKYFGDMSGTELKIRQYCYDEYKSTSMGQYINEISNKVKEEYKKEFGEVLV